MYESNGEATKRVGLVVDEIEKGFGVDETLMVSVVGIGEVLGGRAVEATVFTKAGGFTLFGVTKLFCFGLLEVKAFGGAGPRLTTLEGGERTVWTFTFDTGAVVLFCFGETSSAFEVRVLKGKDLMKLPGGNAESPARKFGGLSTLSGTALALMKLTIFFCKCDGGSFGCPPKYTVLLGDEGKVGKLGFGNWVKESPGPERG